MGTVKVVEGVRTFVSVDGGMSDNMRPMLYDARYEAMVDRWAGLADALIEKFGARIVLAGVKGFKPVPDFVSDLIVVKELHLLGAFGVKLLVFGVQDARA